MNNSIQIAYTTLDDQGNYTCLAENESGNQEYTYEIQLRYSPIIILDNYLESKMNNSEIVRVDAKFGGKINLECLVDGNPKPKVSLD